MLRREQRYYTYITTSLSGTLYTGVTNNIRHRVDKHKEGAGSEFTARYQVNRLVPVCEHCDCTRETDQGFVEGQESEAD
jgi:predicted GIY-YIG superfamily endonuclease